MINCIVMGGARLSERTRMVRLRNALGLTQRELASEFGVATTAIAHWESGKRRITGPALKLLGYYESELGLTSTSSDPMSLMPIGTAARRKGSLGTLALWLVYRSLAATATTSSIRGHLQRKALERYVLTASRMKGLSMKLLQISSFLDMVVDDRDRRILAEARAKASPMPERTVTAVFAKAFGKTPDELFATFSLRPFDVTSLGQVHHATLRDGRRVVVKVQHPLMTKALEADLANIEYLDELYSKAVPGQSSGVVLAEIRARVLEECDYVLEARHQREFGELFAGWEAIHIPVIIPEFSAKTVLTTERAEGMSFDDFVRTGSRSARNRAFTAVFSFVNGALHRHGIFNADIHIDNFLFAPDGRVAFLDFGRVKRLSSEWVRYQRQLTRAIFERDSGAFVEALHAAGLARAGFDYASAYRLFASLLRPALGESAYEFTPEYMRRLWRLRTSRVRFDLGRDHVFLEPYIFGSTALMGRLGAEIECRPLMLDLVYGPNEPRPRPYTAAELAEVERMADS